MPMTDETIRQEVGRRLRAQLDRLGISATEGAARCVDQDGKPYSEHTLRSYLAGRRSLTIARLYHLARGLEVSPRALLPEGEALEGPFTDVTLRVRLDEGSDLDALEVAMVEAAEAHANGGRVVLASLPFPVPVEPEDVAS